jgi:hypothetical protein
MDGAVIRDSSIIWKHRHCGLDPHRVYRGEATVFIAAKPKLFAPIFGQSP